MSNQQTVLTKPKFITFADTLFFGFTCNIHNEHDVTDFIEVAVDDNNLIGIFFDGDGGSDRLEYYTLITAAFSPYLRGPVLSLDTDYLVEMKVDFANGLVTPRINGTNLATFSYTVGSMVNLYFGARLGTGHPNNHTLDNLTVGTTTWGSSDKFAANFNDFSIVPPFDSVTGTGIDASSGALVINNAGSDAYATKAIAFP